MKGRTGTAVRFLTISCLAVFSLFPIQTFAANFWTDNPANCPLEDDTIQTGVSCSAAGEKICGTTSNRIFCYNMNLLSPSGGAVSNTSYGGGFDANGGYVIDCYSNDSSSPLCDNSANFWCNRKTECVNLNRMTQCTAGMWSYQGSGAASCISGSVGTATGCIAGKFDCVDDGNGALSACLDSSGSDYLRNSATHATYGGNCSSASCKAGYIDCTDIGNNPASGSTGCSDTITDTGFSNAQYVTGSTGFGSGGQCGVSCQSGYLSCDAGGNATAPDANGDFDGQGCNIQANSTIISGTYKGATFSDNTVLFGSGCSSFTCAGNHLDCNGSTLGASNAGTNGILDTGKGSDGSCEQTNSGDASLLHGQHTVYANSSGSCAVQCASGFYNADGDIANGCEVQAGSTCDPGNGLSGTWTCNTSSCTCTAAIPINFQTGVKTSFTTGNALLWGEQKGTGALALLTNSNDANAIFTVDNSGRVGIGTSSPGSSLDINTHSDNTSAILTLGNTEGSVKIFRTDASPELSVTGSVGDVAIDSINGKLYVKATGNETMAGWSEVGSSFWNKTGNDIYLADSNSYLGIGTTDPSQLLSIGNNNQFTVDASGNVVTSGTITGNLIGNVTGNISGNAGTVTNGVYTNAANVFSVINPLTTLAESWIGPSNTSGIYFKAGNVGIGTTSPGGKLTINVSDSTPGNKALSITSNGNQIFSVSDSGSAAIGGSSSTSSSNKFTVTSGDRSYLQVTGSGAVRVGDVASNVNSSYDSTALALDVKGTSNLNGSVYFGNQNSYLSYLASDGTAASNVKIAKALNNGPATLTGGDTFGSSVANIGDLNGDGIPDLASGAPGDNSITGAVYISFMNSDGNALSTVKIGNSLGGGPSLSTDSAFGSSVASVGDMNGDGVMDLAVGASSDDSVADDEGALYILFMKTDGTVDSFTKISGDVNGGPSALASGSGFGSSIASLGDLNGDGVNDLAVGAGSYYEGYGSMYILFMNSNGTVKSSTRITKSAGGGPSNIAWHGEFGESAANIGDLNGDGVADLAVGAIRNNSYGSFYVLFMKKDGTASSSVEITRTNGIPTLNSGSYFGGGLANVGDLNGDGVNDIAVGAFLDYSSNQSIPEGTLYIIFMRSNGTALSYVRIAKGQNGGPATLGNNNDYGRASFGIGVASLGDLNGDRVADLVVGAPRENYEEGAVFILLMNNTSRLRFATAASGAGMERLTISNTGNIGIGATSPNAGFDVQNAILATSGLARGFNVSQTLTAGADNDALTGLRIAPNFVNGAYAGVKNYGLIVESGNVGIGNVSPNGRLDVLESGAKTSANYGAYFNNIATSSTDSINKYGLYVSSTGTWNGLSANNYGLYVDSPTGGTNNYAAIFAGGNVGIGTTNPGHTLVVGDGSGVVDFQLNSSGDTWFYQTKAGIDQSFFGYRSSSDAFTIGTSDGSYKDRLVIQRVGGNVGIGTTSPSQILEVAGGNILLGSSYKTMFNGVTTSYVGAGRNNDISLVSNSGWLRFGATSNAAIQFWTNGNAATDDLPQYTLGGTQGNLFYVDESGNAKFAGNISAPTSINTINGLVINSGALTGVSTLNMSGAISAANSSNTLNGMVVSSGQVTALDTLLVKPSVTSYGQLTLGDDYINGLNISFDSSNGHAFVQTGLGYEDYPIIFGQAINPWLYLSTDGNVGIGGPGSAPGSLLSVGSAYQFKVASDGTVTTSGTINGLSINSGALSGITTLSMNNQITNSYVGDALVFSGLGANINFTGNEIAQIKTTKSLALTGGNVSIGDLGNQAARLDVYESGAKTGSTDYGIYVNNVATSASVSVNKYGLYVATGGSWNGPSSNVYGLYVDTTSSGGAGNYAASFMGGNVGIGTTTPAALIHGIKTTEQLRIGYDSSNYNSFTVGSNGALTIAASGTNPNITLTPGGTGYTILNGNVGIGLSDPASYKLDVLSTSGNGIHIKDTGNQVSIKMESDSRIWESGVGGTGNAGVNGKYYIYDAGTGGGTRLVIDTGGNVGIGTSSPAYPLDITSTATMNISSYGYLSSGGTVGYVSGSSGNNPFSLHTAGRINIGGEINVTSDQRLKNLVDHMNPEVALDAVNKLDPLHFTWRRETNKGDLVVAGLFAQEVRDAIPEAVTSGPGQFYSNEYTLNYDMLTTYGLSAIQALSAKNDSVQSDIADINVRISDDKSALDLVKSVQEQQMKIDSMGEADLSNTLSLLDQRVTALEDKSQSEDITATIDTDTLKQNIDDALDQEFGKLASWNYKSWTFAVEVIHKTEVTFEKNVTFLADAVFKGRVQFADQDMGGTAKIIKDESEVKITFTREYEKTPIITVTADKPQTDFGVKDKSKNGFTIYLEKNASEEVSFDWIALAITGNSTDSSQTTSAETPVPADSQTSSDTSAADGSSAVTGTDPTETATPSSSSPDTPSGTIDTLSNISSSTTASDSNSQNTSPQTSPNPEPETENVSSPAPQTAPSEIQPGATQ